MGGKATFLPCCLLLLACLIELGDGGGGGEAGGSGAGGGGGGAGGGGRGAGWRKLRLGELKHDVFLLEELADNLEHEIEDFYDESAHAERLFAALPPPRQHAKKKRKHKSRKPKPHPIHPIVNVTANLKNDDLHTKSDKPMREFEPLSQPKTIDPKINMSDIYWPKFEEILSMNKRKYDWKNDRWIKLDKISPLIEPTREKDKSSSANSVAEVRKSKHRFNYRRVRLDSGKAKGNIVIAVSAVR